MLNRIFLFLNCGAVRVRGLQKKTNASSQDLQRHALVNLRVGRGWVARPQFSHASAPLRSAPEAAGGLPSFSRNSSTRFDNDAEQSQPNPVTPQQSWLGLGLSLSRGFDRANDLDCGRTSRRRKALRCARRGIIDGVSGIGIGDWLARQIKMNLESLQRTSHVLFWFSIGLPIFWCVAWCGGWR